MAQRYNPPDLPTGEARLYRGYSLLELVTRLRLLFQGRINSTFQITLTPGAVSTTLNRDRFGPNSVVLLAPATASAATAVGAGVLYWSCAAGVLTITHDNQAAVDRTFNGVILG